MIKIPGKKGGDEDDGIIFVRKTEPHVCGGTDETLDTKAPTTIVSEEMTMFSVECSFRTVCIPPGSKTERIDYVYAFADRAGENSFLYLRKNSRTPSWALVEGGSIFGRLVAFVKEKNLAKGNGRHSTTHGLPENFGGSVDIRYAGGERISFSNNQFPIISMEVGAEIAGIFGEAMEGPKIPLPDISRLRTVAFREERKNGGFTRATLTILEDGTGINRKSSRYDEPRVYESEKTLGKDVVDLIKEIIEKCGILAWKDLPPSGFGFKEDKTLIFTFDDGTEVEIRDDNRLPYAISGGFFGIELEITTKG